MTKQHTLHLNGSSGFVFAVKKSGVITVSGWTMQHHKWKVGDSFILRQKDGSETCYTAISIRRPGNPADQYFMDMTFTPRKDSDQ